MQLLIEAIYWVSGGWLGVGELSFVFIVTFPNTAPFKKFNFHYLDRNKYPRLHFPIFQWALLLLILACLTALRKVVLLVQQPGCTCNSETTDEVEINQITCVLILICGCVVKNSIISAWHASAATIAAVKPALLRRVTSHPVIQNIIYIIMMQNMINKMSNELAPFLKYACII